MEKYAVLASSNASMFAPCSFFCAWQCARHAKGSRRYVTQAALSIQMSPQYLMMRISTLARCRCLSNFPRMPGTARTILNEGWVAVQKLSVSSSWQTPPGHLTDQHKTNKPQQSSKHQYTRSWRAHLVESLAPRCRGGSAKDADNSVCGD